MRDTGLNFTSQDASADLSFRDVDAASLGVKIVHRSCVDSTKADVSRQLARRQAIESIVGHLKTVHPLDRRRLKGEMGDRMHVVLYAAEYELRSLIAERCPKSKTRFYALFNRRAQMQTSYARVPRRPCAGNFGGERPKTSETG